MNNSSTQIEKDILFLQDICEMSNEQCDEIINACEDLGGISAEYFCEEFVFVCEDENGESLYVSLVIQLPPHNLLANLLLLLIQFHTY